MCFKIPQNRTINEEFDIYEGGKGPPYHPVLLPTLESLKYVLLHTFNISTIVPFSVVNKES